ncbi:glycine--tRNA ligase subunit alpha [Candidatus Tachikawaea gelatinosa]|uniref:Glycine--tRNA ligase alpha subunit n=1 Tax=Candidatus Tachikawaea gelatinosa TaxID=1410383 RepID=A0A090AL58_9ENTR|nr:glycine--tRNA ligase subunit alpha [Candidatus Tachikawaea gelatinosa]BAP58334.1 glycine--tRNA ligase alpha subunit [Candidatus Tachikawaea gelatinosa]
MNKSTLITFQNIIRILKKYWSDKGCNVLHPIDLEVGAGTSHPFTFFGAINNEPMSAVYLQPSRRPNDGRYGKNSYRLQHYYQLQVIIKPPPQNIQDIYINSLKSIGIDLKKNDVQFIEDNWSNPSLGACGVGWEVWMNGIEITQFTYFQQMGGISCKQISVEITYGLERLAMHVQQKNNVYDIIWDENLFNKITYGDFFLKNEQDQSAYNFEYANVDFLLYCFNQYEKDIQHLINLKKPLPISAYELALKAIHCFNLMNARQAFSVTERQDYILRLHKLTKSIAKTYCKLMRKI